jgi:hypothetical protein
VVSAIVQCHPSFLKIRRLTRRLQLSPRLQPDTHLFSASATYQTLGYNGLVRVLAEPHSFLSATVARRDPESWGPFLAKRMAGVCTTPNAVHKQRTSGRYLQALYPLSCALKVSTSERHLRRCSVQICL